MVFQLLKEYSQVHIANAIVDRDSTEEIVDVLNRLAVELTKNKWRCSPSDVPTDTIAMCAFYEMFVRKIGGDAPIMLCYYYSSRVIKNTSLPINARLEGYKHRAFIVFKNMDKLDMTFSLACNAPIARYKGNLNNNQFVDLLLLSDVYQAWDTDDESRMLQNLKQQAPKVAATHPSFSKKQIITEGALAHDAVLNIIKNIVE